MSNKAILGALLLGFLLQGLSISSVLGTQTILSRAALIIGALLSLVALALIIFKTLNALNALRRRSK